MIDIAKIEMVDLKRQYLKIKEEVDQGFEEILRTAAFINGPPVKQFCLHLEDYLEVKQVIPCGNGTDALQIALMALDLEPGDEIITVPFTFVATAEVIALLQLKPVFIDVDPKTFNMDPTKIEAAITDKTRCILPVHLYGQPAPMEEIMAIAKKHNLYVVEDNAQAIGADYTFKNGTVSKVGTIGHIGCTSFYPSKNLGCYGDGGALFSSVDELCEKIRTIANHGQREKYKSDLVGVNSRMDSFQGVVLKAKLKKLDHYITARTVTADFYDEAFSSSEQLEIPYRVPYGSHVFHQYTLKVKGGKNSRNLLKEKLQEAGIPSMIYYPVPLHLQKAYQYLGYQEGDLPVTEALADSVISLPMHTELDSSQLNYIVEKVLSSLE